MPESKGVMPLRRCEVICALDRRLYWLAMLVVMDAAASAEQIDAVVRHIERLGLKALPIPGAYRTAVCVTGQQATKDPANVENFPGVKEVILVTQPYKLVSREAKPDDSVIS